MLTAEGLRQMAAPVKCIGREKVGMRFEFKPTHRLVFATGCVPSGPSDEFFRQRLLAVNFEPQREVAK